MLTYIEPTTETTFDPDVLVSICIENGAGALLLDDSAAPIEFFDLSTRVAGELLHGLSKYALRLAVVVPDVELYAQAFQAFARESNRGQQARFFASRNEAVEWLESFARL